MIWFWVNIDVLSTDGFTMCSNHDSEIIDFNLQHDLKVIFDNLEYSSQSEVIKLKIQIFWKFSVVLRRFNSPEEQWNLVYVL